MKLRGTAFWASVQAPNTTFDPVWCVDLAVDKATADTLKKAGLKPRKEPADDGREVFKFKRKTVDRQGNPLEAPVVLDQNGKPTKLYIGNGSEVAVQINIYNWNNSFGSGVGADFQAIRIIDLVEYKAPDGAELLDDDEDGAELLNKPSKPQPEFDDALPDSLL